MRQLTVTTSTVDVKSALEQWGQVETVFGADPEFPYRRSARAQSNPVRDVVSILEPRIQSATTKADSDEELYGRDLLGFLREMVSLIHCQDDWEAPTKRSYDMALSLVPRAYKGLRNQHPGLSQLPVPFVATDDEGGVRMAWHAQKGQVRVNFGATDESRSYIYFEAGTDHGIEDLQDTTLAERLYWLIAG